MAVNNKELQVGKQAAKKLQSSIRSVIAVETINSTGALMRTKVTAKKERNSNLLQRLQIASPHYGYKLNYGFTGTKSNQIPMNLAPTEHLHKAIEQTSILNELATQIGNIRADEITASINF